MPSDQQELRQKIQRFELSEARWVHEDVIAKNLYPWVNRLIVDVVERRKYGPVGRLFHFCVEYFYVLTFLKIRIQRNKLQTLIGGKGFRPGSQRIRLDAIRSTVFKRGKEVAKREFPIGVII